MDLSQTTRVHFCLIHISCWHHGWLIEFRVWSMNQQQIQLHEFHWLVFWSQIWSQIWSQKQHWSPKFDSEWPILPKEDEIPIDSGEELFENWSCITTKLVSLCYPNHMTSQHRNIKIVKTTFVHRFWYFCQVIGPVRQNSALEHHHRP